MASRVSIALLLIALMTAAVASAQDVTAEYSRADGGALEMLPKDTRTMSGSLGFTMSQASSVFGDSLKGYNATLGGTLLDDRLWFFASAQQQDTRLVSSFANMEIPERAVMGSVDAKLNAQIGDRQNLSAFFQSGRYPTAYNSMMFGDIVPTTFLSLRYTGIVSNNMFFSATVSRRTAGQPE